MMAGLADWRREWRWRRKRAQMYARSDVLVLSRTKSGRTWLRVMLSHLFHQQYRIPERELLQYDNFHRLESRIPRIHFTHDTVFAHHRPWGRALRAKPRQALLFLIRDPRDVALSYYLHLNHRASERELAHKAIPALVRRQPPELFVLNETFGAPDIIRSFNKWWDEAGTFPRHLFIRYEDLRADCAGELRRICGLIDLPASDDAIGRAVQFAAFDRMRERERSGFFASDRLGGLDPSDLDSYKVRQGKVGGYRQKLDESCVAALDEIVRERLNPAFGYRGDKAVLVEAPAWHLAGRPCGNASAATDREPPTAGSH
jgi:hypothetical protein